MTLTLNQLRQAGATIIPLSESELDSFKWRHPMFGLDMLFGTELEGENIFDAELNGYVYYSSGVWYWIDREHNPGDLSLLNVIASGAGSAIGAGVQPVADSLSKILIPAALVIAGILLIQSGAFSRAVRR